MNKLNLKILPNALENIIKDYTYQLILAEKMNECMKEIKKYTYIIDEEFGESQMIKPNYSVVYWYDRNIFSIGSHSVLCQAVGYQVNDEVNYIK